MKKIMILAVAMFALAACGGNNNKNHKHGTHTHEDGTVHQDYANEAAAPVQESFKVEASAAEYTEGNKKVELIEGLVKLREHWKGEGWNLQLATCAEDIDLEHYGIEHNKCIDGELMERLFLEDKALVYYLKTGKLPEPNLFGDVPEIPLKAKNLKDKGQRKICGCMISKDIGMYNTCSHFCVYCYANTSKELVQKNCARHSDDSESIIE